MKVMRHLYAAALAVPLIAQPFPALSEAHAAENPWSPEFTQVAPIQVRDPKAAAMVSVAEGEEPVFEIGLDDVGLYFGYLIPAHVAGFETTRVALQELYPDSLPERGQIRVAAPRQNDIKLVASYLTGAREFYLVGGVAESDLVIDPTLGADRPGKYVMVFQRKDTGKAVEAVFDRAALVPDNVGNRYGRTAFIYIDLLNGRTPEGDPGEHRQIMSELMDRTLTADPARLYSASTITGYTFPSPGSADSAPPKLEGPVAQWFEAGEAMDSAAYAALFADDGRLTIGNQPPAIGADAIAASAQGFFELIVGLTHEITAVWTADDATIVEGTATYTVPGGRAITLPIMAAVRLDTSGHAISDARVYVDPSPVLAAINGN